MAVVTVTPRRRETETKTTCSQHLPVGPRDLLRIGRATINSPRLAVFCATIEILLTVPAEWVA
jgi:hypothetical protein